MNEEVKQKKFFVEQMYSMGNSPCSMQVSMIGTIHFLQAVKNLYLLHSYAQSTAVCSVNNHKVEEMILEVGSLQCMLLHPAVE
jgi:hypothetical protein